MLTSKKKHDKIHFTETIVIGIYKNLAAVRSRPKRKTTDKSNSIGYKNRNS